MARLSPMSFVGHSQASDLAVQWIWRRADDGVEDIEGTMTDFAPRQTGVRHISLRVASVAVVALAMGAGFAGVLRTWSSQTS